MILFMVQPQAANLRVHLESNSGSVNDKNAMMLPVEVGEGHARCTQSDRADSGVRLDD